MRRKDLDAATIEASITRALLALMAEDDFDKLTVTQVTQRAGVDRTTYYRHFKSKEQVVERLLDGIVQEQIDSYRAGGERAFGAYLLAIFTTLYRHKGELLAIHRAGQSHLMLGVLNRRFRFGAHVEGMPLARRYETAYAVGGIYNDLVLWFDRGMAETPEQMVRIALTFKGEGSLTMLDV